MSRSVLLLIGLSMSVLGGCSEGTSPATTPSAIQPEVSPPDPGPTQALLGTVWQWVGTVTPVERIEVADPARYTLLLQADGKAVIQLDCNRGGASYEITGHRISFGPIVSTRMACAEDSQDGVFMKQLVETTSYFTQEQELFLEMPYDSGTMRFSPAPH